MSDVGKSLMVALEKDVNGACYGVFPNCPLMDIPNANAPLFYAYVIFGRTIGRTLGMDVIGPRHLALVLIFVMCLLIFVAKLFGIL